MIADSNSFAAANYHDITKQRIERIQGVLENVSGVLLDGPEKDLITRADALEALKYAFVQIEETHGKFSDVQQKAQSNGLPSIELF